jgi:hypothetical protein
MGISLGKEEGYSKILRLIGMWSRFLLLAYLVLQSHSTSLRLQTMTTYTPRPIPHVTLNPTDITYVSIPHYKTLYNVRGASRDV